MSRAEHPEAVLGWALLVRSGLFDREQLDELWSISDGPAEKAWRVAESGEGFSSSESLFVKAALDTWNRHGGFDLGRALAVLDADRLKLISELLVAIALGREEGFVDFARSEARP